MSGIDRLRTLADAWGLWAHDGALADVADQIEREQNEDADAIAWVRDHGGLDSVKSEWRSRVPYDRYERSRQRLLDHITECETALGRRRRCIEELEGRVKALTTENAELRKRAMPEGMEWPRYEDGELVKFGDELEHYEQGHQFRVDAVEFMGDGWRACYENDGVRDVYRPGERVKRPAPKVLDADGAEIRVGDTVYDVDTGEKMWVCALPEQGAYQCVKLRLINGMFKTLDQCRLTHERPESKCRDCAHWQKDPTADKMGVCWFFYHEHEGQDCYPARLGDISACEEFMPRASVLAERERGE